MAGLILAINPGSSSNEFGIFEDNNLICGAYYERGEKSVYVVNTDDGQSSEITKEEFEQPLDHFIQTVAKDKIKVSNIKGIGLRVVAPGRKFLQDQLFDTELYHYLKQNINRAPLHIAATLRQYDNASSLIADAPIIAISDSAFHKTISHEARNYAISRADADKLDLYRFGYHGLSVQSVVRSLEQYNYKNIIILHLGSGASVTAVQNGLSLDTSMGYSPLEGLVMSTRAGNIDVGAAIYLQEQLHLSNPDLLSYLNKQSGLLGISGQSNDIRELIALEAQGNSDAALALSLMVYRIRQYIGSYTAILGSLDTLVFTATVGERSEIIRDKICKNLGILGIELDPDKNINAKNGDQIQSINSPVTVAVIEANEIEQIAINAAELV